MNLETFRNHLAESIGIKGDGNTLSEDRANYLETIITNAHAQLVQLEIATFATSDIPEKLIEPFVDFCAADVKRFGRQPDKALKYAALKEIRYLVADQRHGVGQAEYF